MNYQGYGIVYSIRNTINDKRYIGRTKNKFNQRYRGGQWWNHTCSQHLKFAAIRYGVEAFEVSILQVCHSEEELAQAELRFINKFNSADQEYGYNMLHPTVAINYANRDAKTPFNWSAEMKEHLSNVLKETWKNQEFREQHSKAVADWWSSLSDEKINEILDKRANTRSNPEWREYLSDQVKQGQANMTPEQWEVRNAKHKKTLREMPEKNKTESQALRSAAIKAHWDSLSPEEREAKKASKNAKIAATMRDTSNPDDYAARVAKRLSRTPEEMELSDVKRILDRFGPDWAPTRRSHWYGREDRFNELKTSILGATKPTVIILAGQSGVGKTWVTQNANVPYVCYDKAREGSYDAIARATGSGVVLFDVVIRSKQHRRRLEELGYDVKYVVVKDTVENVTKQLVARGSKRLDNVEKMNAKYERYSKIAHFTGTSSEVLAWLASR